MSEVSPVYKISITDPSENEENISGGIIILTYGPEKTALATVRGFPIPTETTGTYSLPDGTTQEEVAQNGEFTIKGNPSLVDMLDVEIIVDELIIEINNVILNIYGIDLGTRLIYTVIPPDNVTETNDPETNDPETSEVTNKSGEFEVKKNIVFNVESDNTFINTEYGVLTIFNNQDGFDFGGDDISDPGLLGDEYSEGAFGGLSEEQIIEQDEEVKEKVKAEQQFTDVSITGNWDTQQQSVIDGLLSACDDQGIDNEFVKIAILSVSGKETNFRPQAEIGYGGTPNSRLVEIWPYLKKISDSDLTRLKKDNVAFFDNTYGGKYGNSEYKDGYKFRGRGPNQLTFKDNYKNITKVSGIDFTTNPDWLNDPIKGGVAGVTYLVDRMKTVPSDLAQYKDLNTVPNLETAILIVFRANAGWGKDISDSLHQQTLQKCRNISKYFS